MGCASLSVGTCAACLRLGGDPCGSVALVQGLLGQRIVKGLTENDGIVPCFRYYTYMGVSIDGGP